MKTAFALMLGLTLGTFAGFGVADDVARRREALRESMRPRPAAPIQASQILRCPVSLHGIDEWHRQCRAKARSDSTQQLNRETK